MSDRNQVAQHYTHGSLLDTIRAAVRALGKTEDTTSVEDLAPIDEFHIGGRQASIDFLDQLRLSEHHHVLDVGCGLGGTSRFVASRYGARVSGIDLTSEYVSTGEKLCSWVGLSGRITLHQGSALDMPFDSGSFDGAYMMHVGMNIPDKRTLFSEVRRVLRPGAFFGVYDVMRTGKGELSYPLPWATTARVSAVASPEEYSDALGSAGFELLAKRERRDFALDFFEKLRAKATGVPPALGLHILMGESTSKKLQNMIDGIRSGLVAPVEFMLRNPG